jgi:hypothetical protein
MKRFIISVFAITFLWTSIASGQALLIILFGDQLSTETFQMGINASGSASTLNGLSEGSYRYDWAFGAFGEVKFTDKWYLHFDLTIKTPAGANDVEPFMDPLEVTDSLFSGLNVSRKINYITLPVYIKYAVGSFKFGLGGQLGYMTSATDVYSGSTLLEDDFTMDRNVMDNFTRWDAGLTGMVDFFFKPEEGMRSLRLSLSYYYGMLDIMKENNGSSVNNSIFLLSLAIPVGGSDDD